MGLTPREWWATDISEALNADHGDRWTVGLDWKPRTNWDVSFPDWMVYQLYQWAHSESPGEAFYFGNQYLIFVTREMALRFYLEFSR